ncbi:sugar phosphate permease [Novosphingobium sp. SG751A]|uniref:MFS transporter n=1 Tax=Novosphingobium sp. SG751A TaxID=2587000 RepID=UPI001554E443|nr:MFS transporter [Novosphingobium sp. SG751A]NOW44965.1 sugar phosphate permease [Novosphingobium sp. SG751A]
MGRKIHWKRRYTVLIVLALVEAMAYMDRKAIFVVLPFIAEDFKIGPVAMGMVSSAFSAAYVLAQIPGGMLNDRLGIRKVASFAIFSWSVFLILTGAAINHLYLLLARFGFGAGHGVYFPGSLNKTLAVWVPKHQRATATAAVFAFANVGKAIAAAVVLSIATMWNWRVAFFVLALPCIVLAALFWRFVPNSPDDADELSAVEQAELEDNEAESASVPTERMTLREVIRQPNILKWFSILFTFEIIAWAFPTWLPTYLLKARGFSTFDMGLTITLSSLGGALGAMMWGWLSDRFFSKRRHLLILGAQLLASAGAAAMLFATSHVAIIAWATVASLAIAAFFPAFWAMPMEAISKTSMGLSSGVINIGGQTAAIIAPTAVGLALQLSNNDYNWGFGLQIGATILSFCIAILSFGRREQRTVEPASVSPRTLI